MLVGGEAGKEGGRGGGSGGSGERAHNKGFAIPTRYPRKRDNFDTGCGQLYSPGVLEKGFG